MRAGDGRQETRGLRRRDVLVAAVFLGLFLAGCARRGEIARLEWVTMGTVAAVQVRGGTSADLETSVAKTKEVFAQVERLLNAHDASSELRRLAPLSDNEVLARCDGSVRACYAAAFDLRRRSGGVFNPRWRGADTLDLGAIAKGFAVDVAATALADAGADTLIDLGGNLKSVRGTWRVGIAGSERTLTLTNGMACATSAEYFRGKHIHDGRTGGDVTNAVRSVTVVHPSSAMLADGLSTTLFILGRAAGTARLSDLAPESVAVWQD